MQAAFLLGKQFQRFVVDGGQNFCIQALVEGNLTACHLGDHGSDRLFADFFFQGLQQHAVLQTLVEGHGTQRFDGAVFIGVDG